MNSNLANFLIKLSQDPLLLSIFQNDPKGTLDQTDLSEAEKAVLLSGDISLINAALSKDSLQKTPISITIKITLNLI